MKDKDRLLVTLRKLQEAIPAGIYCYDERGKCPFWELEKDKPDQENGYCHYLKTGDWKSDGLLWDQCKECGINDEDEFWDDIFNKREGQE